MATRIRVVDARKRLEALTDHLRENETALLLVKGFRSRKPRCAYLAVTTDRILLLAERSGRLEVTFAASLNEVQLAGTSGEWDEHGDLRITRDGDGTPLSVPLRWGDQFAAMEVAQQAVRQQEAPESGGGEQLGPVQKARRWLPSDVGERFFDPSLEWVDAKRKEARGKRRGGDGGDGEVLFEHEGYVVTRSRLLKPPERAYRLANVASCDLDVREEDRLVKTREATRGTTTGCLGLLFAVIAVSSVIAIIWAATDGAWWAVALMVAGFAVWLHLREPSPHGGDEYASVTVATYQVRLSYSNWPGRVVLETQNEEFARGLHGAIVEALDT